MTRPTLAKFKEKALKNNEVKKEYETLSTAYNLKKKLIAMRKNGRFNSRTISRNSLYKKKQYFSFRKRAFIFFS